MIPMITDLLFDIQRYSAGSHLPDLAAGNCRGERP